MGTIMATTNFAEHAGIFFHKVASSKYGVTLKMFEVYAICILIFEALVTKQRRTSFIVRCFIILGDWNGSRSKWELDSCQLKEILSTWGPEITLFDYNKNEGRARGSVVVEAL
jgi:hypothetical protein